MNTKHTPAPWKFNENVIEAPDGLPIHHAVRSEEEKQANARLIAAAPELLEAAVYAVECLNRLNAEIGQIGDNGDQALQSLESAIQKATQP